MFAQFKRKKPLLHLLYKDKYRYRTISLWNCVILIQWCKYVIMHIFSLMIFCGYKIHIVVYVLKYNGNNHRLNFALWLFKQVWNHVYFFYIWRIPKVFSTLFKWCQGLSHFCITFKGNREWFILMELWWMRSNHSHWRPQLSLS